MRVLVAGGSGVIGRQLLPMLRHSGFEVVALVRQSKAKGWLDAEGFENVSCDVFNKDSLCRAFESAMPDVVINQLTAIPENINPRRLRTQMAETNRLRTKATSLLADTATQFGVARMISQSITFAYAPQSSRPADENQLLFANAPSGFDRAVEAIQTLESATLTKPKLKGTVLRYGHFCGPGTAYAPGGSMWTAVSTGRLPILGGGQGQFSFVHVQDAANAAICALQSGATGIFNIVDNTPVAVLDWLPWYARRMKAGLPKTIPVWVGRLVVGRFGEHTMVNQVGVDNGKARRRLGWRPQFDTWKDCLGNGLEQMGANHN